MSPGDSTVLFRALPVRLKLSRQDRCLLVDFASILSRTLADARPFTCLVSSDRALRKLNAQFLGHDYATDVLSFPAPEQNAPGDSGLLALGDLAISLERAAAQASEFEHSLTDEVRILMLHGLLHLLGYDHETDRGRMARAERKWRLHFALPDGLIARNRLRNAAAGHAATPAHRNAESLT